MKKLQLITVTGLLIAAGSGRAADLVLEAGAHFGGDTLAIVYNNQQGNEQEIKAGQLLSLAIGARFDISESLEMPITIGMKIDAASFNDYYGNKVDVTFVRYPVNALLLYKSDRWRLGGGLTYHLNPEFTVKGGYYDGTAEFKSALGLLGEFRYFFSERAYVGGRYTNIEYEAKSTGKSFSGNSIGVVIGANL